MEIDSHEVNGRHRRKEMWKKYEYNSIDKKYNWAENTIIISRGNRVQKKM